MPPTADRLLVILSDIEMGNGGPTDDFPHSVFLGELIASYNGPRYRDLPVDLVLNGDTFDLLKTPWQGAFPRHITAEVALGKLAQITAAHPAFFAALRTFLEHPYAERRVHFVVGNHDAELVFPEVQAELRRLCNQDPRVLFPGFRLAIGRVLIEHGSQADRMFMVDEEQLFVEYAGERILHISWGAAALLETVIPLRDLLGFHDRLKPRERVLQLVPEISDFLMGRFRSYWLRDFWRGYFGASDPTKELTWPMLKEVLWRFRSHSTEVQLQEGLAARLGDSDEYLLYVLGHTHEARWTSFGDRKILQAGCLRNEYMLSPAGDALWPMPKSYVEAWLREGRPVLSTLIEVEGPPEAEGYVPASIFDVARTLRELGLAGQVAGEAKRP
jgi:UDP-2,3-diacylglucosamine pyrophosphatase LpxH